MKLFRFALGMILTLMLGFSSVVYAAESDTPTATFDGTESIKYNYDRENFGTNFQNMQPGEERTQEIVLRNIYDRTVSFFMKAETLRSFEDMEKGSGAAYQVLMTVTEGSNTTIIYGGSEDDGSARIGADTYGLKDMNGNITEWFMIATLGPDEEATVALTVSLDGESHTNDYQAVSGTFAFEFQASYDDPEVVTRTEVEPNRVVRTTPGTTDISGTDVPTTSQLGPVDTGDTTQTLLYLAAGAAALLAIILAVFAKRRNRGQQY